MKRLNHLLLALLIALPTFGIVLACGPDDEQPRPRIPQNRLKPNPSTKRMSPAEKQAHFDKQAAKTAAMLVWPEGAGDARDPHADLVDCQKQADADPRVSTSNPLVAMTWIGRCLEEKGWEIDPSRLNPEG